jgi:hypothetical protein
MDPSIDPQTPGYCDSFPSWRTHLAGFIARGAEIVGLTPTGRATVHLLNMNAKHRLQLRSELLAQGCVFRGILDTDSGMKLATDSGLMLAMDSDAMLATFSVAAERWSKMNPE